MPMHMYELHQRRMCFLIAYTCCVIWFLYVVSRVFSGSHVRMSRDDYNKSPDIYVTYDQQSRGKTTSFIYQFSNSSIPLDEQASGATKQTTCREQTNLVYIKQAKCASDTLASIFQRFGLDRGLSFVTPLHDKATLGWPWPIHETFYRPTKSGQFNILCAHSVHNEELITHIMPADTVYIVSLRQPFAMFKSLYNFFFWDQLLGDHVSISKYIHNLEYYEAVYTSRDVAKYRMCVPDGFHASRNLMAYTMGFPTGFLSGEPDMSGDESYIADWISRLDKWPFFGAIVEYFHESLVLLRRRLCWNTLDIIYRKQNVRSYSHKEYDDPEVTDIYRNWSDVDHVLYDHFNHSLWQQIANQSADFFDEVHHFGILIHDIESFCVGLHTDGGNTAFSVPADQWGASFQVDQVLCKRLASQRDLSHEVKRRWDEDPIEMTQPVPTKEFC